MSKKVSRTSSSSSRPVRATGILRNIPVDVPSLLRPFWGFARKMAKLFSRSLLEEEEKEEELLKVVRKNFRDRRGLF